MEFKICYKSYPFKPSLGAMKQFKDATGLDLWATMISYAGEFDRSRKEGDSVDITLAKLAQHLDFVQSAQLLYCLAKPESNSLTIDEIEDAMFHAGIVSTDRDSDMSQPYPFVIYKAAIDIFNYHEQLTKDTKKP